MLKLRMRILSYTEKSCKKVIKESLKILKAGGLIAYPTESFYALGVLATDEDAARKLYRLKKRPLDKPLPIIVGKPRFLSSIVRSISPEAEALMEKFWPGPLTLIFEALDNVPPLITGSTGKIAVRIPGESFALELARSADSPVTATSANPSGKPPAQSPEEVITYFGGKIDLVIDGGKTAGGRPSTIVDVTVSPPKILRKGRISLTRLQKYKNVKW